MRRAGVRQGPGRHRAFQARRLPLSELFREASWDEALDVAAAGLRAHPRHHAGRARASPLAGFGSAKGSNEEAYLFQKLMRTGLRTHNVDHCTRLCHASSVAALIEGLGSGAVTQPGATTWRRPTSILLIGANPASQPPGGGELDQERRAARRRLILADRAPHRAGALRAWHLALPARHRRGAAERHAARHRRRGPDRRGLHRRPRNGFEAREGLGGRSHARGAWREICGIEPATIREVARAYARSKAAR